MTSAADPGADGPVEVPTDRFDAVMARREEIVEAMRDSGFRYVTLDLEGFRSGSRNLTISRDQVRTGSGRPDRRAMMRATEGVR